MWELEHECTGDYGLSDCEFVTEETWDLVEELTEGLNQWAAFWAKQKDVISSE